MRKFLEGVVAALIVFGSVLILATVIRVWWKVFWWAWS
jgi:hypothetical protein